MDANSDVMTFSFGKHFPKRRIRGCCTVNFLNQDVTGVKTVDSDGYLPIQHAARESFLGVLILLHEAYPESLSVLMTHDEETLLHLAFSDESEYTSNKVQYLYDKCPALIHQKNNDGASPLHSSGLDFKSMICICNADATALKDKYTLTDSNEVGIWAGSLCTFFKRIRIQDLLQRVYACSKKIRVIRCSGLISPASAGIKNSHLRSPYDLVVSKNLSVYFIRMLLSADPIIDPLRRHDLNFSTRCFLLLEHCHQMFNV
jgi:hypothetical protein